MLSLLLSSVLGVIGDPPPTLHESVTHLFLHMGDCGSGRCSHPCLGPEFPRSRLLLGTGQPSRGRSRAGPEAAPGWLSVLLVHRSS